MKILAILSSVLLASSLYSQHTFSIAAVDSITGEIGSAGATCLSQEDGALWVSDIVLNVGAINTQAWWTSVNQRAARIRMEAGESPQEIIDWLTSNDNPAEGGSSRDRQYGIVDLNNGSPRSAAYTGTNNYSVKGHRTGPNYAIQGNILISEEVLDDMESAFITSEGTLAEKLMASLQAAKRPGADVRCLGLGISSASAYLRVAQPTDTNSRYGNLWLDLNAWLDSGLFTGDPIDEIQKQFDAFMSTDTDDLDASLTSYSIFPNPTSDLVYIKNSNTDPLSITLYNILGNIMIQSQRDQNNATNYLDLSGLAQGHYILKLTNPISPAHNTYIKIIKSN